MSALTRRYVKTSFGFLVRPLPRRVPHRLGVPRRHTSATVGWLVTMATAARAVAEILTALGALADGPLIAAGGLGQTAAAVLFVVNIWWRIRMPLTARL